MGGGERPVEDLPVVTTVSEQDDDQEEAGHTDSQRGRSFRRSAIDARAKAYRREQEEIPELEDEITISASDHSRRI